MSDRLLTLIRVYLIANEAKIRVRGRCTITSYRALVPIIRRTHAFTGIPVVIVDLIRATTVDPDAVRLLRHACSPDLLHLPHGHVRTIVPATTVDAVPAAA